MKFGRNELCPCGSGKKYKHCHYGKPFSPERDLTVRSRNMTLLAAAQDIFGFRRGRNWSDLKRNISGKEIKQFYEVQASLWAPDMDWASIMPQQKLGQLRGLYLGDIRPDFTFRNLTRFSLYSDQLMVIDPFHNPWTLRPEYNPIENPDQYKADTLNLLHFLFSVAPWIQAGILYLIPDPGSLNVSFKWETVQLAKARIGDLDISPKDLEAGREVGLAEMKRMIFALPDDQLISWIEKSGPKLSEEDKRQWLAYARQELRNDPVALEQAPGMNNREAQIMPFRAGANLETALLLCNVIGAFPYTNMMFRWQEIVGARDALDETARIWSPLTKAFQELDFRFLNNVDAGFAQRIREEGRLESFRVLLRRIGKEATEVTNLSSLESFVRDCKDELIGEYQKGQAEWAKIDESFLKWTGGGAAAVAAGFVSGHLVPDMTSLSPAIINTLTHLGLRYLKQQRFRKANPMSIFIDLSQKEPPGVTLL